ncbi:MAG TPA: pyrroline-5-carboxylate reductase [Burkholderiaceae bacterium]|jgi:pyrroline-5-carboxylate reductase
MNSSIAFIGGGNMAGAIIRGLLRAGRTADSLVVVEPSAEQRERLRAEHGLEALGAADARLANAQTVVWAVKPQLFVEAAKPCAPFVGRALQLSVMAGLRCDAIERASASPRVVRAMPNTPALMGAGVAGLFAAPAVTEEERALIEQLLAPTGELMWVEQEADLDTVTALSGSGPAYFFYFVEAMMAAGVELGLSPAQARKLAFATCRGAAVQGLASDESPALLRERVTSKGGTTHAAITSLERDDVAAAMRRAVVAAHQRAQELGDEFSR